MLTPYRVLDLTEGGAQLAGLLLAQLGAEVVLVEPPGGSPARGDLQWWDAYNRGKRSVVLDLDDAGGRAALDALARTADVVLESNGVDGEVRPGLGEALAGVNPALVRASITPFGLTGPKAGWVATDLVVQAAGARWGCRGTRTGPRCASPCPRP